MRSLIIDVNSPNQQGLLSDFTTGGTTDAGEYFNQDAEINLWIRPVIATENATLPWVDDYAAGDAYYLSIGNPDGRSTGGTFSISLSVSSTAQLAYNITAAALETALEDLSIAVGYGALTVTLLTEGVFQVDWSTMVAVPALTGNSDSLIPACQIEVTQIRAGSGSTYAQQIIDIRQTPVATATLTTDYVETAASTTLLTSPTLTVNAVYSFSFGDAYDGFASVSIVVNGVTSTVNLSPTMSEVDLGLALALHPEIYFQDAVEPDNISVTFSDGSYVITFLGTLGSATLARTINAISVAAAAVVTTTAAHGYLTGNTVTISGSNSTPTIDGNRVVTVLSATTFSVPVTTSGSGSAGSIYTASQPAFTIDDTNLVYPQGNTGTLNLNTVALAKAFWGTTEDELSYDFQIRRTRTAGETRTIFGETITLKRELIDAASISPVPTFGEERTGSQTCAAQDYVDVAFSSAMTAATYSIIELYVKYNGAGASPYKIAIAGVEDATTSGFRVWLSGDATTDYSVEYLAAI